MDKIKKVEEATKEFFELLGLPADFSVIEAEGYFHITLTDSDASGLLIGKQGDTLYSMQLMLSFILKNKLEEEAKVVLDVGGYREKQKGYLENLAQRAYERLQETGEPQYLYNLNPSQRRVVHTYFSPREDVITESEGDGEDRRLVIKAK